MWQAQEFAEALQHLRISGTLEASGRRLGADALDRLFKMAPTGADGEAVIAAANFRGAVFEGDVSLAGVRFVGSADFTDATFEGDLSLSGAAFDGSVRFDDASFERRVWFGLSPGHRRAAVGDPGVAMARFQDLCLTGARFERAQDLGCLDVAGTLICDGAEFRARTALAISAATVSIRGVRFSRGVGLVVFRGDVLLEGAQFGEPSEISAAQGTEDFPSAAAPPRLLSLKGAEVADLLLSDIALTRCRFSGAHGLDRLRIEGRPAFVGPPTGWQRKGRWPFWRWAQRDTVFEEHEWRRANQPVTGWLSREKSEPDPGRPAGDADQVAAVYRALRKGREDNRDSAGGADFYFGEMEMKRQALRQVRGVDARVERLVLTTYWLISAYGLRAGRALLGLSATVALFGIAFYAGGLLRIDDTASPSLARALLFSAQSAAGLFAIPSSASATLSYGGEVMQLALRILGPFFIGLAILSLRGRIRR